MEIVDDLTKNSAEIPIKHIEALARTQGIDNCDEIISDMVSRGLLIEQNNKVSKIVKRLFW